MKSLAESRAEWKAFHEKAKDGCIFCDGDGVGIKDKNGEIFEPARHGYIGWYGEDLVLASFAAKKCEFRFIRPDGRYYDETRNDEGLYAEERVPRQNRARLVPGVRMPMSIICAKVPNRGT